MKISQIKASMDSFLKDSKNDLKNVDESSKIHIVLGNESCDLDSAVSSLVFAYFIHKVHAPRDIVIPILNVARKELHTRSEVVFFFQETGLSLSDIVCVDEIDLKVLQEKFELSVILVDHNALNAEQAHLSPSVSQVIDHHAIDNPNSIKNIKHKIEAVGSCCTLVAEEILNVDASLLDPPIAMLLYGTILLDTVCLNKEAKRATKKDEEMVSKLEAILEGVQRLDIFETLQKVKFDVSALTAEQLLYRDTKYVQSDSSSIAIASFPALLQDVLEEVELLTALEEMRLRKNLESVVLLGLQTTADDGSPSIKRRQVAVYNKNPDSLEKMCHYLMGLQNPSLDLKPVPLDNQRIKLFDQDNITLSRKFILPALQSYLNKAKPDSAESYPSTDSYRLTESYEDINCNINPVLSTPRKDASQTCPIYQPETIDFPKSPVYRMFKDSSETGNLTHSRSLIIEDDEELNYSKEGSLNSTLKRIAVTRSALEDEDQRSLSSVSHDSEEEEEGDDDAFVDSDDDSLIDEDIITLPDEFGHSDEESVNDSPMSDSIPEMSAAEEFEEDHRWKSCTVNGEVHRIDMKIIEPYRKVLSHGGYEGATRNAIIVFMACYLPDHNRKDYNYVMDNLFLYVVMTLDELVTDDYIFVYFHGATQRSNMPSFGWLKRCYKMLDRRLRKNLKGLYLVHPTFWVKTIVIMTKPFISTKFTKKLKFVSTLKELSSLIPLDQVCIPEEIKHYDAVMLPEP